MYVPVFIRFVIRIYSCQTDRQQAMKDLGYSFPAHTKKIVICRFIFSLFGTNSTGFDVAIKTVVSGHSEDLLIEPSRLRACFVESFVEPCLNIERVYSIWNVFTTIPYKLPFTPFTNQYTRLLKSDLTAG